jgi:hypothetical protein
MISNSMFPSSGTSPSGFSPEPRRRRFNLLQDLRAPKRDLRLGPAWPLYNWAVFPASEGWALGGAGPKIWAAFVSAFQETAKRPHSGDHNKPFRPTVPN